MAPPWCVANPTKPKDSKNILDFLFPSSSSTAGSSSFSDIEEQQEEAKKKLHSTDFGLNFSAYKNIALGVWAPFAKQMGKGRGEIFEDVISEGTKEGIGKKTFT